MSWYPYNRYRNYGDDDQEDLLDLGTENNGKIGLSNIGNTCFMNSALQCIFHNVLLKAYFMHLRAEENINEKNPLGTKGALFKEILKLFRSYYRSKSSRIVPSSFKNVLGNNNSIFEGYQQHDSQEFWSYVIDMIHEDSNRILTKPYVENLEGNGKEEEYDLARKSWINFLKRNYSVITQNCIGQFKSRVDCITEGCNNTSITFDPFTIVSLSIPNIQTQAFDYVVIPVDDFRVLVEKTFSVKSGRNLQDMPVEKVVEGLAKILEKNPKHLRMCHFNKKGYAHIYKENDTIAEVQERKGYDVGPKLVLSLIELNDNDIKIADEENKVSVCFLSRNETSDIEDKPKYDSWDFYRRRNDDEDIITSFFYLRPKDTVRDLHIAILRKVAVLTNLIEENNVENRDQEFFKRLWNRIEIDEPYKTRFFYIKSGDKLLSRNLLNEPIENVLEIRDGKVDLKVFLRSKDYTTVEVNLTQKIEYNYSYYHNSTGRRESEFEAENTKDFSSDISIQKLFRKFEDTEILDEKNAWKCPKCKKEVRAKKSMKIYKAPNMLTVHFKKIKGYHNKNSVVEFPTILDIGEYVISKENIDDYQIKMEEFMNENDRNYYKESGKNESIEPVLEFGKGLKYKLYGIVNHSGSQNFGHYTSTCKVNNEWVDFNDSSASETSEDRLVSDEAYILFYQRI